MTNKFALLMEPVLAQLIAQDTHCWSTLEASHTLFL